MAEQDPDMLRRLGGWLFRYRTSIPLPIVAALLLIPPSLWSPSVSTSLVPLGVPILAAGEGIRLWAVHHIGAISRTRSDRLGPLIDGGPFALVRNPLYLGNILLWVGFALLARLAWLAPIVAALLALEYHAIVRWEEGLLTAKLGPLYEDYMGRVPRWIPRLGGASGATSPAFSWRQTVFSERGTLIAIVAGLALLYIKSRLFPA